MKVGAASALTLAGMAAHASISQPSTGSSDAILFAAVVNTTAGTTVASYAGDTGISISTLAAGGYSQTGVLGNDTNLANLYTAETQHPGDVVEFAVLGAQYTGQKTAINFETPGVAQFLTTTNNNGTISLMNDTTNSLVHFAGLNSDISTINSNSNSANSIEGPNPLTAGVWDPNNTLGTAYWDGGATSNANPTGGTQTLFYVTSGVGGSPSTKVAYSAEENVSLTSAGLNITALGSGGPPPVPLPAAVWLLGSGLLGLTGVARRKLKA